MRAFRPARSSADALEAAATGKERIATPRELAAYVTEVLGEEVSAQREAVRAWIARSEPSQVGLKPGAVASTSVSAAAMSLSGIDPSQAATLSQNTEPRRRSPVWMVLLVLLLLVAVGGGSFLFARETNVGHPAVAAQPSPVAAATSAAPVATVVAEPAASDPSALPTEAPSVAKPPVLQQRPRAGKLPASDAASKKPKKPEDDVDLRNPYR